MEGLMYARGGEESGIAVRAAGTFKTPACAQNTGKVDPLGVPAARKASPLGGWSLVVSRIFNRGYRRAD